MVCGMKNKRARYHIFQHVCHVASGVKLIVDKNTIKRILMSLAERIDIDIAICRTSDSLFSKHDSFTIDEFHKGVLYMI